MLCILCVALIVCVALISVIDNRNVMFARVLTPAPVMLSCLLPSQRFKEDEFAHLQPRPREERRQLLVIFAADQFDVQPGRCDAGIHRIQATDGLVRQQTRPCRAPDVCPVSRSVRPSTRPRACPIVHVFATRTYSYGETKKNGGVLLACDYCYLISFTVGDVSLIPTTDEVLRDIVKRHVK